MADSLHEAVARAIAKTMRQPGGWTEAELAAAAVRVVLAEAQRSIEARLIDAPQTSGDAAYNIGLESALAALSRI